MIVAETAKITKKIHTKNYGRSSRFVLFYGGLVMLFFTHTL